MMAGRYAHAKQFRRHRRQLPYPAQPAGPGSSATSAAKIEGQPALEEAFALPPGRRCRRSARSNSVSAVSAAGRLYSFHAPEVQCIGKGKASAPYEFGVKASIVTKNNHRATRWPVRAARQGAAR